MDKMQSMLNRMAKVQIEETIKRNVAASIAGQMAEIVAADRNARGVGPLAATMQHCRNTVSWLALDNRARARDPLNGYGKMGVFATAFMQEQVEREAAQSTKH